MNLYGGILGSMCRTSSTYFRSIGNGASYTLDTMLIPKMLSQIEHMKHSQSKPATSRTYCLKKQGLANIGLVGHGPLFQLKIKDPPLRLEGYRGVNPSHMGSWGES